MENNDTKELNAENKIVDDNSKNISASSDGSLDMPKGEKQFDENIKETEPDKLKTNGMSYIGLVFAIVFPPIGLIVSMIARAKSKNDGRPTGVSTVALVISSLLFVAIVAGGGYYIYKNYNRTKQQPQSTSTDSTQNQQGSKSYNDNEKKAISQSEQFLNFIKSEDYANAFKMLSPELQKEYPNGEADFTKEVTTANLKLIDSWSINNAITNGSQDRITVSGDANFKGSTPTGKFEFQFYKDNDGSIKMFLWQISPST